MLLQEHTPLEFINKYNYQVTFQFFPINYYEQGKCIFRLYEVDSETRKDLLSSTTAFIFNVPFPNVNKFFLFPS